MINIKYIHIIFSLAKVDEFGGVISDGLKLSIMKHETI